MARRVLGRLAHGVVVGALDAHDVGPFAADGGGARLGHRGAEVDAGAAAGQARGLCHRTAVVAFAGADQRVDALQGAGGLQAREGEPGAEALEGRQPEAQRLVLDPHLGETEERGERRQPHQRGRREVGARGEVGPLLRVSSAAKSPDGTVPWRTSGGRKANGIGPDYSEAPPPEEPETRCEVCRSSFPSPA